MIHNEKQAFSTLVAMQNEFCRQFLFIPYIMDLINNTYL